ncbi:protein PilJ [Sulfuriferula plumbiphila]|uniref:Protein PilJ n=1 Tax=Sulfuriferula plumbiphila TaxID=171865 RepID=A0A512LA24_9PROT|nr:methyl-accepting chemotaxis protein [Sulfuriferula plumbiphila]BBP05711.1 protein PilJ [Sulfuriferula plumbiphila]GEP31327.1 protein PilJ [Sulfuriferula plumbiphila]
MAISFPGFNLKPSKDKAAKSRKSAGDVPEHTTLIMSGLRKISAKAPGETPLIGHLPIEKQYMLTLGAAVILIAASVSLLIYSNMQAGNKAKYIGTSTEMQMLSQRIAKGAQQAVLGTPEAFKQLQASRILYKNDLAGLVSGNSDIPASPNSVQPLLSSLDRDWKPIATQIDLILGQEKTLVGLHQSVGNINKSSSTLLELSEQLVGRMNDANVAQRPTALASEMVMLTQRMAKNANTLLSGEVIDQDVAFQLGKDATTFKDIMNGLHDGSEKLRLSAVTDPDVRTKLEDLITAYKGFEIDVNNILASMQPLVEAKQAGHSIFTDSDKLLADTQKITAAYQGLGTLGVALAIVLGLLGAGSVALFAYINTNEAKRRALQSEAENKRNQEAILRLLNELGDLSEGDLTISATVNEDITGAIADSINFTIDELRTLVAGIERATEQVNTTTAQAKQVSDELLSAAQRQSREIEDTSTAILDMSQSINEVSASASQSAQVAHQSLEAAEKGTHAVQNSIAGMNGIREQIQETSKRIKRLGESSQEIGEIVELISDITEQTNVLALNAAIQAASAGEAGRGFSVVAEEVQRLAERSGQATKQIAAIVKTIQSDTQDAVAAMETSTQGVVEGAKLSDAAGRALSEISQVSRNLAALIENISTATEAQATAAAKVARTMQDIQNITEQTTTGTSQTASSIGALSGLAADLKKSIAGFKLA